MWDASIFGGVPWQRRQCASTSPTSASCRITNLRCTEFRPRAAKRTTLASRNAVVFRSGSPLRWVSSPPRVDGAFCAVRPLKHIRQTPSGDFRRNPMLLPSASRSERGRISETLSRISSQLSDIARRGPLAWFQCDRLLSVELCRRRLHNIFRSEERNCQHGLQNSMICRPSIPHTVCSTTQTDANEFGRSSMSARRTMPESKSTTPRDQNPVAEHQRGNQ